MYSYMQTTRATFLCRSQMIFVSSDLNVIGDSRTEAKQSEARCPNCPLTESLKLRGRDILRLEFD